jgi:ribosomal-protein-alanine N-acetyltransferase
MAFLKSPLSQDTLLIRGLRVYMRPPAMGDYASWAELRAGSREHLVPWEPQWTRDELSRSAFRRRLRHYQREQRDDLGYAFFIFALGTEMLVGGITLSNIRRGVSQAGSLGYWIGAKHARQGLMSDAVRALVHHAFAEMRLHRLEAACLPVNYASIGVLERCGFEREGLARHYLKINGMWQDHLLFARINDDPRLGEAASP